MSLMYLSSVSFYIPELLASLTMVALLIMEATYNGEGKKTLFNSVSYIGLIGTFFALLCNLNEAPISIFTGSVVIDSFGTFVKILMVLGTIFSIYLSTDSLDIHSEQKSEFSILVIGVLVGGMLLASAHNLLILYIGIETLSILSYALASFRKNDERSSEAGLKYALFGGVVSGIMLFGMGHIFGVLGTIDFLEIGKGIANIKDGYQIALLIPSLLFFMAGIGYKIACVPFHMWAPDVYEGSPLPVTTFFSLIPKIAGITAFLRVTIVFFAKNEGILQHSWIATLAVIAALTMTVGNVSAIGQRSVKRMLAFSSISHAGFMLLGVLVLDKVGAQSILFYASTYVFMTLVVFFITSFVQDKYGNDHFERFSGLIYRYPFMAIFMSVSMFSLAGIPPFAGFVAKFNVLSALISKDFYTLALIAVLNSVVSLFYYMKIIRLMVFGKVESQEKIERLSFRNQVIVGLLSLPILILGIFWSGLIHFSGSTEIFLQ